MVWRQGTGPLAVMLFSLAFFGGASPLSAVYFPADSLCSRITPKKRATSAGDLLDNDRFVAIYQAQMVLNGYNFFPWGRNNPGRESP